MNGISLFSVAYGILALLSLLILLLYARIYKDRYENRFAFIFIVVTLIDVGHMALSLSRSLPFALAANRFIYFWTILLLALVLVNTADLCNITFGRAGRAVIAGLSLIVCALVFTGGTSCKWYYSEVSLTRVNNVTRLVKEYGPLHKFYYLYVILIFLFLLFVLIRDVVKKRSKDNVNPSVMLILMLENIFVWTVGRYLTLPFEILTAQYLISEIMMLLLIRNVKIYDDFATALETLTKTHGRSRVDTTVLSWKDKYRLTAREYEVPTMLLENGSRKDIAEKMVVSEHTVKKHTAHIYEKIGVSSRSELLHRLNEEIIKAD